MVDLQTVARRLKEDLVRNVSILNFMADYPVHGVEIAGDSLWIRGTSDRPWIYISSENEAELLALTARLNPQDRCFAATEDWMLPFLSRNKQVLWDLCTMRYYFPDSVAIDKEDPRVVPLEAKDAPHLYKNSDYKEYMSVEYVEDRIQRGPGAGIRENGVPVAWAMTQDDGAIGFLHVLETHRKQGLGKQVMVAMIQKVRASGRLPFACVKESNTASITLLTRLGFQKDRLIHWIEYVE